MKIGVYDKNKSKTVYTYVYKRIKSLPNYTADNFVQYEIVDGTDQNEYIWSEVQQAVVVDETYVASPESMQGIIKRKIINSMAFGKELITDFATENVLLGITQNDKTADVLAVMTEQILLPNARRSISIKDTAESGSLYELIKLLDYHINRIEAGEYDDLSPYITKARFEEFKDKINAFLAS
jgi:hypothetical protein